MREFGYDPFVALRLKARSDPAGQSLVFIPRHLIPPHGTCRRLDGDFFVVTFDAEGKPALRLAAKLAFSDRVDKARWRVVPSLLRRRCDPRNERGGLHPARTSELT
jgi:hypothetical protein